MPQRKATPRRDVIYYVRWLETIDKSAKRPKTYTPTGSAMIYHAAKGPAGALGPSGLRTSYMTSLRQPLTNRPLREFNLSWHVGGRDLSRPYGWNIPSLCGHSFKMRFFSISHFKGFPLMYLCHAISSSLFLTTRS